MNLSQEDHDLYIPDSLPVDKAIDRTTHLGIGAHQDDLEFMALHGILSCFQKKDCWFGGVTCTDGAGSSRTGAYAHFNDDEMKTVRVEEQKTAAKIGQFSFAAQLGHPSSHAKSSDERKSLVEDIKNILQTARPQIVYTHNPFDKHATHIGIMLATLTAIRELPKEARPQKLFGCEVWRALDWLPDSAKSIHDVSAHPNLAASLNGVFDSQITGGKRYDLAVEGRRLANATFFDSHSVDDANRVQYAIDLSELISEETLLEDFMQEKLTQFNHEIFNQLKNLL
ncbi:MAG: LmbE family N-acetylglucosaminyl deacetylase [Lentimonas sp.]|jgi:LmbE family N-acetylglucosaminyl deacetylase